MRKLENYLGPDPIMKKGRSLTIGLLLRDLDGVPHNNGFSREVYSALIVGDLV